ncbi:MAG: hypothetical protein VCE74_11775 [Alphaproteobacteria bacterium]|jgi:hypothetical protein|tara:strand:- start:598 stop:744 length:147 start_codon:yes stop_codon:yes gene_type:complete
MIDIVVPDVPDFVIESIKRRAEINGRTFDQEVHAIVLKAAEEERQRQS